MTATAVRRRARSDLVRLANRDLDLPELARRTAAVLDLAVPADGVCLLTLDPATLLPTGEYVENGLPADAMPRLGEIERREDDFNKFVDLARRPSPAASLSAATQGELDRSVRQRELREPCGFGDELRVTVGDDTGTWAALTLLRVRDRPEFADGDVRFMASVAKVLAEGVRRALFATPSPPEAPGNPGVVILAPDGSLEMTDRGGDQWLGVLADDGGADAIPVVVSGVADQALRDDGDQPATARVRTRDGQWVVVRGSLLGTGPDARAAVYIEAAHTPELAPLLVAAYGFTARERQITELVARGYTTNEMAASLEVTPFTIQDHLKAIFAKSGTGSRGELVARLFLDHHLPGFTRI
jgi:DNA-binding CsgD family transcriptional regulator